MATGIRPPRVTFEGETIAYLDNRQLLCRAGNISITGMLIYAPNNQGRPGQFLRLVFTLPGLGEWVDADAVIIREALEQVQPAWGVQFLQVPSFFQPKLLAFINDQLKKGSSSISPADIEKMSPILGASTPQTKSNPDHPASRSGITSTQNARIFATESYPSISKELRESPPLKEVGTGSQRIKTDPRLDRNLSTEKYRAVTNANSNGTRSYPRLGLVSYPRLTPPTPSKRPGSSPRTGGASSSLHGGNRSGSNRENESFSLKYAFSGRASSSSLSGSDAPKSSSDPTRSYPKIEKHHHVLPQQKTGSSSDLNSSTKKAMPQQRIRDVPAMKLDEDIVLDTSWDEPTPLRELYKQALKEIKSEDK